MIYALRCLKKMKTDRKAETERGKRGGYEALKPPRHYDGPWYSGPPRNPLIPPALCASDSFMSSVWEMADGKGGVVGEILICLLL